MSDIAVAGAQKPGFIPRVGWSTVGGAAGGALGFGALSMLAGGSKNPKGALGFAAFGAAVGGATGLAGGVGAGITDRFAPKGVGTAVGIGVPAAVASYWAVKVGSEGGNLGKALAMLGGIAMGLGAAGGIVSHVMTG